MEELCQPSLNGRGGPIAPISIQATNFGLKNDMIQQVHNSYQFHGLPGDDANKYLDKFLHVTQSIKVNGVTDDTLRLNEITNFHQRPDKSLYEAWECYKLSIDRCPNHNMLPVTQIDTFYNGLTLRHRDTINAAAGGTFMKRRPEECYDLIKNMTAHHNDWDTSAQRSESSSSITSSFDTEIAALKAEMAKINKNLIRGNNQRRNQFFQGASHGQNPAPAYQALVYQAPVHQPQIPQPQVVTTNEFTNFMKFMKMNTASSSGSRTLLAQRSESSSSITSSSDTKIAALKAEMAEINKNLMRVLQVNQKVKAVTPKCETCGGPHFFNDFPATNGNTQKVYAARSYQVERETEATKDMVHLTNSRSTKDVQPLVVQTEYPILISKLVVAPIIEPVVAPVSAPEPNQKPSISYPSRLHEQKLCDKANDQREKYFQIFKDLNFNISFVDALILMPKFGSTIKTLLTNKDKLSELARTPLNEHCSMVLLKKLPEKLGDPSKFLIPCDFPRMAECLTLADLGTSINLMPLSVWNQLSLPDLSPTCMTLDL
nr:reverse transcriptase domain-containing protein [Tanacetum cinerariifolium]